MTHTDCFDPVALFWGQDYFLDLHIIFTHMEVCMRDYEQIALDLCNRIENTISLYMIPDDIVNDVNCLIVSVRGLIELINKERKDPETAEQKQTPPMPEVVEVHCTWREKLHAYSQGFSDAADYIRFYLEQQSDDES